MPRRRRDHGIPQRGARLRETAADDDEVRCRATLPPTPTPVPARCRPVRGRRPRWVLPALRRRPDRQPWRRPTRWSVPTAARPERSRRSRGSRMPPHPHCSAPPGTTMCPMWPALPVRPPTIRPPRITPPPTPVETTTPSRSGVPRPAPSRCSARAAAAPSSARRTVADREQRPDGRRRSESRPATRRC